MLIGSKKSSVHLVRRSIASILKNIGTTNIRLVIGVAKYVDISILKMVAQLQKDVGKDKIIIDRNHCDTFAAFTNYVIVKYTEDAKWFLISHDDIELKTEYFIGKVVKEIRHLKENIGWISFTDDDYLNGHRVPSTRPGFHSDYVEANGFMRNLFQLHNGGKLKYDFPTGPVRCHAPFSHFILIETKKLKQLGLCEDWSVVSLLIDEDWGLTAMLKGMVNIWIPNIIYNHSRPGGKTRAGPVIKKVGVKVGNTFFFKKWGFSPEWPIRRIVKVVEKKYCNTNIAWSIGRKSFDWDYMLPIVKISYIIIVYNGMPYLKAALESIYESAHEVIIVEGPVSLWVGKGNSTDGTIECIKSFPDPEKKIKLLQGSWPEKCEMQNAALIRATGSHAWLVDSDEIYKKSDIDTIKSILEKDPSIYQVKIPLTHFWKNYNNVVDTKVEPRLSASRIFKIDRPCYFTMHRPPTMFIGSLKKDTNELKTIERHCLEKKGVTIYHYSLIAIHQVKQKTALYKEYGWEKPWGFSLDDWFNDCFTKWTSENKDEIEKKYPTMPCAKGSKSKLFTGTHPESMKDIIEKGI